jgi:hypothetical protein
MSLVTLEMPYFPDPTAGRPIFNGSIYIGEPDTDPEVAGNQKTVLLRQENGVDVPTTQPISTGAGGVPLYNGSPVQIIVEGDYSLKLLNQLDVQVYYSPNSYVLEEMINQLETVGIYQPFDNVALMVTESLPDGIIVETKGYYTAGDGGQARYLIKTAVDYGATPDGYGDHTLANGNVAVLQAGLDGSTQYHVKQFGAVGDGTTLDHLSITAAGAMLSSGDTLDFGTGTFNIEKTGTPTSPFGHRILDLNDLEDITIKASRAKIVATHDISTDGGLMFIWGNAIRTCNIHGFDFEMTFSGVHTGSTQYPFCGAIFGQGDDGVYTSDQLNQNWTITDCTFKLYHPYGQYAQSGSAYNGDPNNGFKIFPVFCNGPFSATSFENQSTGVTISNCTLKDGHNGYGFWTWAVNDVKYFGNRAESFVGKQSDQAGTVSGIGEPMIRYHQFHTSGLSIVGNYFRSKPCSERTVAGMEGDSRFIDYNTNLLGDYRYGNCEITGNTIIGGKGDAANTFTDSYINLYAYGAISVSANTFDSTSETSNEYSSTGISWNSEALGGQGVATLSITANTWSANCDPMENISISNGATTAANRRLKQLVVQGNTSLAQAQHFIGMSNVSTTYGVQDINISNNLVSGEFNTTFDKTSSNSRAIECHSSEATDIAQVNENIVRDKYYAFESGHFGLFIANDNEISGVTTEYLGTIPRFRTRRNNAPSAAAPDGSEYIRLDGVAGYVLYIREAGTWVAIG